MQEIEWTLETTTNDSCIEMTAFAKYGPFEIKALHQIKGDVSFYLMQCLLFMTVTSNFADDLKYEFPGGVYTLMSTTEEVKSMTFEEWRSSFLSEGLKGALTNARENFFHLMNNVKNVQLEFKHEC